MKNKFSMALSLALVLALVAATFVLADNLNADGDNLTPVANNQLDFGTVCAGTTVNKPVLIAVDRQGNSAVNRFKDGSTVTVTLGTVTGSGLSATNPSPASITLPNNWGSLANNTNSGIVSSTVTLVTSDVASFAGSVVYTAAGTNANNGALSRSTSLSIVATVVNCDTTPPTLSLPDDMTVEAENASGAAVTFNVSATDTDPLNPTVTCDANSGGTFPLDVTTTVSCSATDTAGNTAYGDFDITVVDTTPPTVTPPSNIIAEATGDSGAVVSYSGEFATDTVDGVFAASCEPISGSLFPLGSNTVICSATDLHGNLGSNGFTIDVQDTIGPIIALPADITAEATSVDGAIVNFSASASDLVDGDVSVYCDWSDGDTFPLDITPVSCSATDSNGNTSSGSFNVNVVDTTAPALTLPADFAVEATGAGGALVNFSTSASDLVDGNVAVSCMPASDGTFPLGNTAVNCSATDAANNTASGSFIVTVQDTTAPSLTLPADQQLEATGPSGAQASFTASATDIVDGALTVTCSANSGDIFPLGTTTVTCSTSDAAGNEASGGFVIIVEDTTAPVIAFVNRTPANANGWNNGDVTVNWSCSDVVGVVDASVSQVVSAEGENQSAAGTCQDTSGNTSSDTQGGINIDKTKPSASATRTPDANIHGWNNTDVTVSFNGTDDRSGIDFCSVDQVFGEGADQTASGTCTDMAGNVSDSAIVQNINVDKTAPTITGAPDRAPNVNNWYNANVTVTFACNDDLSTVDSCTDPVTLGEGGDQSVPGSVTDKAGNSANTTVSGINIDKTAPIITASLDKSPDLSGWFNASTGQPTISFVCSDALSGVNGACPANHTFGDGADQSYSQTIYDLAGNSASDGVTDVDVDTVAPSIVASLAPASPASSGWYNEATGAPTVSFACSDAVSGVVACPTAYTFGNGENQSHSGTVSDNAGNSNSASVNDVDVDIVDPTLTWNGGPTNGASYYFGSVQSSATCTAADSLSGQNGCAVSGYGTTVGSHTMTATAQDLAGNEHSEQRTYTVLAWNLQGFYQPVDMNGVFNIVRNGSTVPLKFEIFAGSNEFTDVAAVDSLTYTQVQCDGTAPQDEIETLATGSTVLRYDTTSGQFIFNWKTPSGTAGKCFRVTMKADDGSMRIAYFKMK